MLINESDIVSVNRKDLITHPKNPRKGNVDLIIESIEENGFYGALIVQKSTGYILTGNHRFVAGTDWPLARVRRLLHSRLYHF